MTQNTSVNSTISDINTTISSDSTRESNSLITWNISRYLIVVTNIISLYVLVSLSVYTWRNRRKPNVTRVNHLSLFSAIFSFLFCLNTFMEQWVPILPCIFHHWAAAIVYIFGTTLAYTMLWLRQWKFYSDDLMAYNVSKVAKAVNAVLIFTIYVAYTVIAILFISTYKLRKEFPCKIIWLHSNYAEAIVGVFLSAWVSFQLIIFFLIVHPVLRGKSTCSKIQAIFCNSQGNKVLEMAKRLALCGFACVFSSMFFCISVLLDATDVFRFYWLTIAAVDITIDTIATVLTFVNWKERLFSLFYLRKSRYETAVAV